MKKRWLLGLLLALSIPALADQTPAEELSALTRSPLSDIQEMLAKCDSDDQTTLGMVFCGWRDLIVAERELQEIVDQRNSQRPAHKAALNARIAHWKRARDTGCEKMAHRELAGGSEEPIEAVFCRAMETQDMVKAMKKNHAAIPCKKSVRVCHDGLMLAASNPALADQTPAQELAAHTGWPLKDIQAMLNSCKSDDQTTIYFCGWRDLIVAERDLQKIVDQRNSQRPASKAALDTRIAQWKKAREADCRKSAHRDYTGKPMEPVMGMVCQADETQDMAKAMGKDHTAIPCENSVGVCHDDQISP